MGPANVEREPGLLPGPAEPADSRFCLEDDHVFTAFMQKAGKGQTGEATTKDRCCHAVIMGTPEINGWS